MWNVALLGDVCQISSSKRIFAKEYQKKGIPFYRGKEIIEKHKGNDVTTELFISPDRYKEIKNKYEVPRKGDVLLTSVGTLGVTWLVDEDEFYFKDGNITWLRPNEKIIPEFLYLWLNSTEAQNQIDAKCIGSTQKALTIETLNKFYISLPSIDLQYKIIAIIKPLEDKIVNNRKINKNLEQQAQVIFKSWFVDFEPFNGEMPHDWIASRLGDIASIKTNSFSPVKNPDAQLEHYSIPAYDEQKYPVFESAAGVKSNKYILSKNSVMISKLNPDTKRVWRPMCLSELAVSSTEFIIFEAFNPAYRDFVFSIIDSAAFSDWMRAHTTGSTNSRQRTAPSATLEFQVALPDEKAIIDFCAIVTPMYNAIASNICENQKLAQLRDSILPKLMSGEIDISAIDL